MTAFFSPYFTVILPSHRGLSRALKMPRRGIFAGRDADDRPGLFESPMVLGKSLLSEKLQ